MTTDSEAPAPTGLPDLRPLTQWPRLTSAIPRDAGVERRVAEILGQLTLEEKVGQMIQPELAELTPEDVRDYRIGSALNGAGIWPGGKRHASVADWVDTVDGFWAAAEECWQDRPFRVPFMWATDAVHGHNNVHGATIFPHNIGLGAAGDPDLVRRIGAVTGREVAATGMDWIFAPTVTTPRDRRWGRYYEGYGEDPTVVHAYGRAMVEGLQGDVAALRADGKVLATLKHWIADGGTENGADRGTARCSEDVLRDIHAQGFVAGIEAGAQSVMVSFSSWENPANYDHTPGRAEPYNDKVHGSRYLLTDVLKDTLGFDGIVISDWDAHAEVAGCSGGDAGYAINAGLDVLMIAGREHWQSVHRTTVEYVRDGVIPMARIDDAVSRVLRVKMRAGLWDKPRPRDRALTRAGSEVIGCAEHRALSREAARKSLVLLKNSAGLLPLSRTTRVLVTGSGADDLSKQCGGWTLTWQGDDVDRADLPGGTTLADAVRSVVGAEQCTVDPALEHADPAGFDVAVVALGEDSYAEMRGTLKPWRSLGYADLKLSYARDLDVLRRLHSAGLPAVSVFFTGRPLYSTEEINLSRAFVVAWLPGPYAQGITDVLFAGPDGSPAYDFQGRLPSSWPRTRDSAAVNRVPPHLPDYRVPAEETAPEGRYTALFPVGHGLSLHDPAPPPVALPSDELPAAPPPPPADGPLRVLDAEGTPYQLRVGGHNTWSRETVPLTGPLRLLILHTDPVPAPVGGTGLRLRFNGYPAFVYAESPTGTPADLRGHLNAGAHVRFLARVTEPPSAPLFLACHDDYPAQPGVDLAPRLREAAEGEWTEVSVPLTGLAAAGMDLRHVDVPFMLYTEGTASLEIADIGWRVPPVP
ncbi:glycoside hydrolase family 3 C-terminal domain-containing protein [Streptomyces sp. ISL-96]|uniref:glycoside hydrolase family 3 protein n=1 Tax=Streptomyces sp. ISL-96 TaxID=2819191 RepID=UPI001BE99F81|nr:glycoside hydrolase family 3 protein [Streptomyces sp. ISL-96]MBT2489843.1 glycoside hydrolase family 3 C-terminal domain-containing protein [Streptomyces sp. ISL-96]